MNKPLVSICCLTYNHEPYIKECIEGFLMQKTNFSFEVLIHDDASIDNTANIIRSYEKKYPDIIKPIYQTENQFSKGVRVTLVFQFPRAQGKYIALCEGDDYWIDPYKLQKQVDFLESNPEIVMTFGNAYIIDHTGNYRKQGLYFNEAYPKIYTPEMVIGLGMPTLTIVFRNSNLIFPEWFFKTMSGDFFLRLLFLLLPALVWFSFFYSSDLIKDFRKKP